MALCAICRQRTPNFINLEETARKAEVCMTCFFDDTIPDPVGTTDPQHEEKTRVRREAIATRAEKIMQEYGLPKGLR
jgi:protein-tyrosine-phosphatase